MTVFVIDVATARDLELALKWADMEGWNPGLSDGPAFFAQDPRGFFVGRLDGEPVGFISCVRYGRRFGFLGLYLVRPEHRGKGFGLRLWRRALECGGDLPVGLDGVEEQQRNYVKSGFSFAYGNVRYEYRKRADDPPSKKYRLLSPRDCPRRVLAAFDARHFGAERGLFLEKWLSMAESRSLVALDEGEIGGYVTLRRCRRGYKIGPLFAGNPLLAEVLFLGAVEGLPPGSSVYLDVPEPNGAATALAERRAMTPVFSTARMYRGTPPSFPLDRVFGVTTFELG